MIKARINERNGFTGSDKTGQIVEVIRKGYGGKVWVRPVTVSGQFNNEFVMPIKWLSVIKDENELLAKN